MIHITSLDDGLELFKALGSDIRIQILKILLENNQMSMNQLANELSISNGALTGHILFHPSVIIPHHIVCIKHCTV